MIILLEVERAVHNTNVHFPVKPVALATVSLIEKKLGLGPYPYCAFIVLIHQTHFSI